MVQNLCCRYLKLKQESLVGDAWTIDTWSSCGVVLRREPTGKCLGHCPWSAVPRRGWIIKANLCHSASWFALCWFLHTNTQIIQPSLCSIFITQPNQMGPPSLALWTSKAIIPNQIHSFFISILSGVFCSSHQKLTNTGTVPTSILWIRDIKVVLGGKDCFWKKKKSIRSHGRGEVAV